MISAVSESSPSLVWTKMSGRGIMLKLARVDPTLRALRSRRERWWGIAKVLPYVGAGLPAASLVVDIALGILLVVFIIVISVLMERLSDAESLGLLSQARTVFEKQSRTPGDAAAGLLVLASRCTQLMGSCVLVAIALGPWAGHSTPTGSRPCGTPISPCWWTADGSRSPAPENS